MSCSTPSSAARRDPNPPSLREKLASVLPQGYKFGIYHLSTPPTRTSALYSAPPDERPDKTYVENHFLAVTINAQNDKAAAGSKRASPGADEAKGAAEAQVLVLGLEIFLFTTAYATTLFVSKADSTGYLHLLNLPRGAPSPIREISAAFVAHLLEHRQRKNIQTVVSLFARAQSQYLFPLSVENKGKHVLSDRGLVRWWCGVLNPLLENWEDTWASVKGYLIVPGLEERETRALLPRTPASATNWVLGHPLERISHYAKEYDWVPLRCLIPKFPDDPKSRYRDELDEEAAKWKQNMGTWTSVKSLAQFWEMMAYRQECSSGRMTGFIWVVFDPKEAEDSSQDAPATPSSSRSQPRAQTASAQSSTPAITPSTPPRRRADISVTTPRPSPLKASIAPGADNERHSSQPKPSTRQRKKKLTGPIIPRLPHVKTEQRNYLLDRPSSTAYYYWPHEGRGEKIVDESDYKRIVELLLHLDFSSLDKAVGSTMRWLSEVAVGANWGQEVIGKRVPTEAQAHSSKPVTVLSGVVRKKPKAVPEDNAGAGAGSEEHKPVNVLGAGLVRKKGKEGEDLAASAELRQADNSIAEEVSKVNVLGAGLVRRKAKAR